MKNTSNDGFPCAYGKYELLARIGQGGMAEVFRARLPGVAGFEKIVVIKRLLPHLARSSTIVEMFVNEAKLAAEVQHRNVVQVFELGEIDGEYYMAMEHVSGTDLRQILRAAAVNSLRVPPWFSVQVVAEVLDGLAHAHALVDDQGRHRNVVHRDVTPANIFVSYMGDVKLGDFGVAKDEGRSSQTRAGQLKGKVPYMSPEQIYGRALDARTDVFAAGVVLWECLTQRRLFGGRPDIEAMNLICYGERKPPSAFASDVPPELDEVVLRALAQDVERRTPSAKDFHAELLDVLPHLRPRVHQHDVRNIVEVVLGNRDPSANTGPKSIHDESVVKQNFLESTPGISSNSSGSGPTEEELRRAIEEIDIIESSKAGHTTGDLPKEPQIITPAIVPAGQVLSAWQGAGSREPPPFVQKTPAPISRTPSQPSSSQSPPPSYDPFARPLTPVASKEELWGHRMTVPAGSDPNRADQDRRESAPPRAASQVPSVPVAPVSTRYASRAPEAPTPTPDPRYANFVQDPRFPPADPRYAARPDPRYAQSSPDPRYAQSSPDPRFAPSAQDPRFAQTVPQDPRYSWSNADPRYAQVSDPRFPQPNDPRYAQSSPDPRYAQSSPDPRYAQSSPDPRYAQPNDPRFPQANDPRYAQPNDPRYAQVNDPRYGVVRDSRFPSPDPRYAPVDPRWYPQPVDPRYAQPAPTDPRFAPQPAAADPRFAQDPRYAPQGYAPAPGADPRWSPELRWAPQGADPYAGAWSTNPSPQPTEWPSGGSVEPMAGWPGGQVAPSPEPVWDPANQQWVLPVAHEEPPPMLDPSAIVPIEDDAVDADDDGSRVEFDHSSLAQAVEDAAHEALLDPSQHRHDAGQITLDVRPPGSGASRGSLSLIDRGQHAERVSDHARGIWRGHVLGDAYEGPHPFWIRAEDGEIIGPLAYDDALSVLRYQAKAGLIEHTAISGTRTSWMSGDMFAMLTGQEMLVDQWAESEKELPTGALAGTFTQASPTALFARLAREAPTGKLIVLNPGFGRFVRREITLVEGRPTFVYANQPDLQLPELLVAKKVLTREQLLDCIHRSVLEDRGIEEIVNERVGYDVNRYWGSLLKERILDLFRWTSGRFALDVNAPVTHTAPFAPSLLSLLPEMIYRTKSADDLRVYLAPLMDQKLERSERFNRGIAELRLSDTQKKAVAPYGGGRTLAQALRSGLKEERLNLAMAYILLETELVLRPL